MGKNSIVKESEDAKARGRGRGKAGGKPESVAPLGGEGEESEEVFEILGEGEVEPLDEEAPADEAAPAALRIPEDESDSFSEGTISTPGIGKSSDPVRMYLREMGGVSLLTREGEVEIAKRIEEGQLEVLHELNRSPVALNYICELADGLKAGTVRLRDIFEEEEPTVVAARVAPRNGHRAPSGSARAR